MIKKKKKIIIGVIIGVILLVGVWISMNKNSKYVAQVNGIGIPKTTYDKKVEERVQFFKWSRQNMSILPTLKKDTIDRLIDESIITQYAEKNKITVSDTEIENRYNKVVDGYNSRNKVKGGGESAFLSKIKEMYGTDKNDYLATLKMDILKEKVQSAVKMSLAKWLEEERKKENIRINQ